MAADGWRIAAAAGAAALVGIAVPALAGVVDRVVPHAVQPMDVHVCSVIRPGSHQLVDVSMPVPEQGGSAVTVLAVRPVGLADPAVHWRSWLVPGHDVRFGGGTDDPPAGWDERTRPGDAALATGARPLLPVLELWTDDGRGYDLRGTLIRYRTAVGIERQSVSPTTVQFRSDGC